MPWNSSGLVLRCFSAQVPDRTSGDIWTNQLLDQIQQTFVCPDLSVCLFKYKEYLLFMRCNVLSRKSVMRNLKSKVVSETLKTKFLTKSVK